MKADRHHYNISLKANRVLNLVLIAMLLIIVRIWHLAVIQYDKKLEESRKPQRRVVIEPAKRATIRDRFNIPLALNKIHYNATILYSQLRQISSVVWEKTPEGKKIKKTKRKDYIASLSKMLADELNLDPELLEDLIHSKAALYYNIPFVIKEDLTEKEFYRLKVREKDWLGLHVQIAPKRYYPFGKTAGDIIGYMGSINKKEYETILHEIKSLQSYLHECEETPFPEEPKGILSESHARKRLQELRGHAYNINDLVGKAGIEGKFEQELRGFHGKTTFYSDARGNFLRELPGTREPLSGQRFLLTISVELQEYCEQLLAQNEKIREARASGVDMAKQTLLALRQPWIKGGAILAIDPKTGEVIAMASYPRFDPNDFIAAGKATVNKERRSNIARWFENDSYVASIWNQKRPLERERFDEEKKSFFDEKKVMSWEFYLERILPKTSPVVESLSKIGTLGNAIALQKAIDALTALFPHKNFYWILNELYSKPGHSAYGPSIPSEEKKSLDETFKTYYVQISHLKKQCDPFFNHLFHNYDKALLVDLCRLAVKGDDFSPQLLNKVGKNTLSFHHDASGAKVVIEEEIKKMTRELFHEIDFKPWRKDSEKEFLKQKRIEEKAAKIYPKPYIEYLDAKEEDMFQLFWKENHFKFINAYLNGVNFKDPLLETYLSHFLTWHKEFSAGAHQEVEWKRAYEILQKALAGLEQKLAENYYHSLRSYAALERPLLGKYRHLRNANGKQLEKHLAAAFYPAQGFGYGRSQAYRQSTAQGSIFKLVPAYAALKQKYEELKTDHPTMKNLNPLEIIDHTHTIGKEVFVGYHMDGKPLPRSYKGGKLPRTLHPAGRLDLLKAIETSSNPYFSLLVGDVLHSPDDLIDAAKQFSYGSRTGIDLPAEIPGKIPDDIHRNRSGLYAMAIGQHSLVVTPLQTSIMLSAIANGGHVLKPQIVKMTMGSHSYPHSDAISSMPDFKYKKELSLMGIDFPLYSIEKDKNAGSPRLFSPVIKKDVFMPEIIRKMLLEGMHRVVVRTQDESLAGLSRFYRDYPEAISDYLELREDLVGKTSTAESVENIDLDLINGTNMYKHVWFGGIAFNKKEEGDRIVFHDKFGEPELVVVVYLRFGVYGKEAAPVAAQVVNKWREIKQKHS
jgi:cell division protein FtsI/penicillin-binding protein 2